MSIQLPTLRSLRSLLDKMKNLAPSVTICSSSNGDLSFIVETDSAMVVSKYYNLALEGTNADGTTRDGQVEEISVLVDSKQLAMCIASIQVIFNTSEKLINADFAKENFRQFHVSVQQHSNGRKPVAGRVGPYEY